LDNHISGALLKQGFLDLQSTYGVTMFDANWACFMAMRFQDKPFARQLLSIIKDDWYESVWFNEDGFKMVKKWANS